MAGDAADDATPGGSPPFGVRTELVATGLLLALGAGAIAVAAWSVVHGGIGWDTRADTAYAMDARAVTSSMTLRQAYDAVPFSNELYGVFMFQLADVLHLLTSGGTKTLPIDDPSAYLYQGSANLILSVVSTSALGVAVGLAFRSALAGAFAWSLTLATPLWLGMSHVDFKDTPVAAGLTLVTAGAMLAFVLRGPVKAGAAGAVLAGAGGAMALATRGGAIALLLPLALGIAVPVLAWGLARRRMREAWPVLVTCGAALVFALAFVWATNPIARIDLPQWLWDSTQLARDFPWNAGTIRVAGQDVRAADLPWWYVPAWLGAQLPLLTLLAVAGGLAALAAWLVRRRRSLGAGTTVPLLPLGLQALVLPLTIVLGGAVLYDGIRHLLFMLPALVGLVAAALALGEGRARATAARLAVALPLAAVLVVAASLWASIRWAPYAYAFVNPAAGHDTSHRDWELDYWGVSAREGVERLLKLGYSPVYVEPSPTPGIPWGAEDAATVTGGNSALYVFLRWNRASDFGCFVLFRIERDGHELGEGARCPNQGR